MTTGKKTKRGFISTIFHEGNINTLYGPPGAGKSNCACFFMEKAYDESFNIFTNIHFFDSKIVERAKEMNKLPKNVKYRKKPDEIHVETCLSGLLIGLLENPKNIVVLDESGIFASSSAATSKKVRQLKELSYIIRHLNSSLLLIAQAKGSIVPDLRKTLVTYEMKIRKVTSKYRVLTIAKPMTYKSIETGEEDVRFVEIDTIGGIPLSRLPWDGYFIPRFEFDIKLDDAFNRLGEYDSVTVLEKGPDVIRELQNEKKKKKKKKHETTKELGDEIREQFLTFEDSGDYKNRTTLISVLAGMFSISTTKVRQFVDTLPFDKEKYNKKNG